MPPTIDKTSVPAMVSALIVCPIANASAMTKATAAVESLKSDSASTKSLKRPSTFASLNVAITETGSVAAISTPNRAAIVHCQPRTRCINAAVMPAESKTPTVANVMTGTRSFLSSRQ